MMTETWRSFIGALEATIVRVGLPVWCRTGARIVLDETPLLKARTSLVTRTIP